MVAISWCTAPDSWAEPQARVDAEVRDDVRHALTSVGDFVREHSGAGTTRSRVFERDRGREARAERRRVGENDRISTIRVGTGQTAPVEGVRVEVEERRRATGGDAGPLDERLVDVDRGGTGADQLTSSAVVAAVLGVLKAEERAQGAIGGLRAGIEVELTAGAPAGRISGAAERLEVAILGANAARDAQAGFRARDVEEAGSVRGADTNVLNRRGLPSGKISGLSPSNGSETRDRTEEKALNELHYDLQSFETLRELRGIDDVSPIHPFPDLRAPDVLWTCPMRETVRPGRPRRVATFSQGTLPINCRKP